MNEKSDSIACRRWQPRIVTVSAEPQARSRVSQASGSRAQRLSAGWTDGLLRRGPRHERLGEKLAFGGRKVTKKKKGKKEDGKEKEKKINQIDKPDKLHLAGRVNRVAGPRGAGVKQSAAQGRGE